MPRPHWRTLYGYGVSTSWLRRQQRTTTVLAEAGVRVTRCLAIGALHHVFSLLYPKPILLKRGRTRKASVSKDEKYVTDYSRCL